MKEFFKYMLTFEKKRFYSGGALRYPVLITQKFWDEMQERKEYYKNNKSIVRGGDTNLGSENADLGNRPIVPDWIVKLRSDVGFSLFIISIPIIIVILFK